MKPMPKLVSVLSILAAVFGALNTADILSVVPSPWGTVITLGAVLTASLSHSLGGNGPTV
jgi:hypothetical protein